MESKKLNLAQLIQQNADGTLSGGFSSISPAKNILIIGGSEDPTNNCGGNWVQACANNAVPGCGGTINTAPRCGM